MKNWFYEDTPPLKLQVSDLLTEHCKRLYKLDPNEELRFIRKDLDGLRFIGFDGVNYAFYDLRNSLDVIVADRGQNPFTTTPIHDPAGYGPDYIQAMDPTGQIRELAAERGLMFKEAQPNPDFFVMDVIDKTTGQTVDAIQYQDGINPLMLWAVGACQT